MSADTDKPFIHTAQRIDKLEQPISQQSIIIEQLTQQLTQQGNHHETTIEQLKECITTQKQTKPLFYNHHLFRI